MIPVNIFRRVYGSLVDEVGTVPAKLSSLLSFKFLSIPWLLVGMLLSNCYLSIFITNLNSPLPGERFDTYQKISCQDKPKIELNKTNLLDNAYMGILTANENV